MNHLSRSFPVSYTHLDVYKRQAEKLILDLLADGKELASEDIVKAAAEAGISERTVQNAKRNMGGILNFQIPAHLRSIQYLKMVFANISMPKLHFP